MIVIYTHIKRGTTVQYVQSLYCNICTKIRSKSVKSTQCIRSLITIEDGFMCTKLGKDNIVINKKKLIELLLPFHGKMKNFDFTKKSNVFFIHKSFHFEKYFVKSTCIDLCFFHGKKITFISLCEIIF